MKILFIFTNINTYNNKQYPHGVGALSAVLKKAGHQVNLIYLTKEIGKRKLLRKMAGFSFDLVGISTTTNQWPIVKEFPAWIKEKYQATPIILGGIHPTLAPEEVINTEGVDIICRGEGEMPLLKLVEAMEKGQDYFYIQSLWIKKQVAGQAEVIRNPVMPVVENLDTMPFSDRGIIDYQDLLFNHSYEGELQEATLMAGRGCPFNCTYCCNSALKDLYPNSQHYVRKRSVDNVIAELKIMIKSYTIRSFYFEDDTFTLNRQWVEEFCLKYKREIGLPFKVYVRPLTFDYQLLRELKEAGLYGVNIGVECGNERFRKEALKRNIANRQLVQIFGWLNQLKIKSLAFIIIGLPDETKEMIAESMDLIKKLKPFLTQISVYYPYPANELHDYCKKNGLLTEKTKTTFFKGISTIKLDRISQKELKKAYQKFWQLSHDLKREQQDKIKNQDRQIKKESSIKNRVQDRRGGEIKSLAGKFYFILMQLPFLLLREPFWISRLTALYKKNGLRRALQAAYDYYHLVGNYEMNARGIRKKIIWPKLLWLRKNTIRRLGYQPKISIIVPVFDPPRQILQKTIQSVLNQSYQNWELCLVDGNSQREPFIKDVMVYHARKDNRIKIKFLPQNKGIAGNSNEAVKMATGEFISLLDHDDELAPQALFEVVKALNNEGRGAELIYTDEDRISLDGYYCDPFHKPDWSPDYLLNVNYICHLAVIKAELLRRVGGFDIRAEGAQDYDLFLRLSEQTEKIHHVPKILYHWRRIHNSTTFLIDSQSYVIQNGKAALERALRRRKIKGEVIPLGNTGHARIRYDFNGSIDEQFS